MLGGICLKRSLACGASRQEAASPSSLSPRRTVLCSSSCHPSGPWDAALGTGGACRTGWALCTPHSLGGAGSKAVLRDQSPALPGLMPVSLTPFHSPLHSCRSRTPEDGECAFCFLSSQCPPQSPARGSGNTCPGENQIWAWGRGRDVCSSLTLQWSPSCLPVWGKHRDPLPETPFGFSSSVPSLALAFSKDKCSACPDEKGKAT